KAVSTYNRQSRGDRLRRLINGRLLSLTVKLSVSFFYEKLHKMNANVKRDILNPERVSRLPPLPSSQEPSDMYEDYLRSIEYPAILQDHCRTLAVPYKELRHHRSPCQTIGNNYRPSSQSLSVQSLQKRCHKQMPSAASSDGRIPAVKKQRIAAKRSHPLTPDQQLEIMQYVENKRKREETEPTVRDLERYEYYIREGIYKHMLASQDPEQITKILNLIPKRFHCNDIKMEKIQGDLLKEVQRDYEFSICKSIVDYILLDPAERERLSISAIAKPFPSRVIRAPVPWFESYKEAHTWQTENLFTVNPMLLHLQDLWISSFSSLRFVHLEDLLSADLPLEPGEFERLVQQQCQNTREKLFNTWLPQCADLFMIFKDCWLPLVPKKTSMAPEKAQKLFYCAAALMSLQLRSLVITSLQDFLQFFQLHQSGNDFGKCFDELQFIQKPVLLVKLRLEESGIEFDPSLQSCWETIQQSFTQIISSAHKMPRVECKLFPEIGETLMLRSVQVDETLVTDILNKASEIFQRNTIGPQRYLDVYKKYIDALDPQDILDFLKTTHSLQGFTKKIERVQNVWKEIASLHATAPLSLFCLDAVNLNQDLCDKADRLIELLTTFVMEENREFNLRICQRYDEITSRITSNLRNTEELVELNQYLKHTSEVTIYKLRNEIEEAVKRLDFLLDYATLPVEDMKLFSTVIHWPDQILSSLESCKEDLNNQKDQAEIKLMKRIGSLEDTLTGLEKEVDLFKTREKMTLEEIKNNVEKLNSISSSLEEAIKEIEAINKEEGLLDKEQSQFPILQTIIAKKQPYDQLWITALNFLTKSDVWMNGPFRELNAETVAEELGNMWRTMYKLAKTFSERTASGRITENFKKRIEKFKQHIPILTVICNPGLKDRHWEMISDVVGFDVKPDESTQLVKMLELGLSKYSEQLEEIGASASKEYSLEKSLEKMKQEWAELHLGFTPYKDTGTSVLSAIDDVQLLLDDHIIKTQTMRGSPFIKPIEADAKSWEEKLQCMQDILDAMLQCQSMWMYLEPIFSSEDIIAQMPENGRRFTIVDGYWKNIVAESLKDTHVLVVTEQPNMLGCLQESNIFLEEIQQGLNLYLETKRLYFPRFFFLSNDEMLEILSETKDPLRVQPHLKKCFEGIAKLEFTPELEITGMISSEKETVPLIETIYPVHAKGMVEKWLLQVEHTMLMSIRNVIKQGMEQYSEMLRKKWVLLWPGQVIICASCIFWTSEVSDAIQNNTLPAYVEQSNAQINDIVELVRGKLPGGARMTLGALIVIDVHARDVVCKLAQDGVSSLNDFQWISQLRYFWEDGEVMLRMITTVIRYGYEYLGNSPRLVITPLTDRCYRTLMGALKLNLGGAPEGPAGTGKTETTKDLAKALAKQCVVFNCSDGLDYKAMSKFFKGLAQSGAWACFDEFNRIEVEVLSVVAQQILSIQQAIMRNMKTFMFEGTELSLNPTCCVFITMNPGYAGRAELPDNLKALFRTVAMMVPDYGLIGEISLYSMGFTASRSLAQKIVATYRLCSEQLSSQPHYDYGMRAVKSVLTAAGNLKLKYPEEDESVLLLRALMDVNMAKFLAQDLPLFQGIITDLFPGVLLPKPDYELLLNALDKNIAKMKLQPVPWFISKIIQVYEMMLVRHDFRIINPKAITMGQLYGCFDPVSHEWSDGVLATSFRQQAQNTSDDRQWIIFDGPIDAVWIENMNTVLDDNKKLCLMSGEIIQMSPKMSLIFEPADLEQASPATVSRCGMIYMEPHQLGWIPLRDSYMDTLPKSLEDEQQKLVADLFNWLVQPCLDFIYHECGFFIQTSPIHLAYSLMRLYTCLLDEIVESGQEGAESMTSLQKTLWLQCLFLFAVVWSLGGTISGSSRTKFDSFYRNLIMGALPDHPRPTSVKLTKNNVFPERGTVYDYYFNKQGPGQWNNWTESISKEDRVIPVAAKVSDLIIPTAETSRQLFFLRTYLSHEVPILIVGPTGTGKSVINNNFLMSLPKERYTPTCINFSARTSANQTQDIIMAKLDRRRKGVFGPPIGKKCIIYVDDLNMPAKEVYGAQPPIELLRQWIDHHHWYDKKDTSRLDMEDVLYMSAMGPPGGGRNDITGRFTRHLNIITIDTFDDETLSNIFTSITDWHFSNGFDATFYRLGKIMVQATMAVFKDAIKNFLPTPSKSHYIFNLRDFARVIRGVMLCPAAHMQESDKLTRLWIHEVYRVFYDRLIDNNDRDTFFN
ncbi:hypothetical protein DNTS_033848, partial [Danionella cerebrum]